jgi:hypothetical protein
MNASMCRYENALPSPTMIYRREAGKLQRVLILEYGCDWHSDVLRAPPNYELRAGFGMPPP